MQDLEPDSSKEIIAMHNKANRNFQSKDNYDLGKPWVIRYFQLVGYELRIYDVQPIEGDLSIRVLVKIILVNENLFLK